MAATEIGEIFLGFAKKLTVGTVTVASLFYLAKFLHHKTEMKRQEALLAKTEIAAQRHNGVAPSDQELKAYQEKVNEYRALKAEEQNARRQLAIQVANDYQSNQFQIKQAEKEKQYQQENTISLEEQNNKLTGKVIEPLPPENTTIKYRSRYPSTRPTVTRNNSIGTIDQHYPSRSAAQPSQRITTREPASRPNHSTNYSDLPPTRSMGSAN